MGTNTIGSVLKAQRIGAGISVEHVSEALIKNGFKASKKTIYSWEAGNSQPTPDALLAMCELYGINDVLSTFGYSVPAPAQEQGPDDEQQLIAYYKKASSYDRHAILRFAEYVVQSASEPSKEVIEEEAQLAAQSLVRQSYSQLGIQEVVK